MRSQDAKVRFARQPIVGRDCNIVAYELLYRAHPDAASAVVGDDVQATRAVIRHSVRHLGLRRAVGRVRAFINMNAESLRDRRTEALPPRRVVLEILETVVVTAPLIARCRELKALGFRLALDDFTHYEAALRPLLDLADIVKIDLPLVPPARLAALVEQLHRHPAKLLAEKVEDAQRADECHALGFDYFQGYFFGRPESVGG